jgi:hypothetical protein
MGEDNPMAPPAQTGPMIRGAFIKDARNWTRTAYGAEAFQSALARLSDADRALVNGLILSSAWYPIASWDRFLDAMRAEAAARKGESELVFDMRNMREAGGSLLVKTVYHVLLSLVGTTTAIDRAVQIYNRAYSEGRCEIVENVQGRAVIRYLDGSPALQNNLSHHLPTSIAWVLEQNGARDASATITRSEVVDGKLLFEVTVGYG